MNARRFVANAEVHHGRQRFELLVALLGIEEAEVDGASTAGIVEGFVVDVEAAGMAADGCVVRCAAAAAIDDQRFVPCAADGVDALGESGVKAATGRKLHDSGFFVAKLAVGEK